MNLLFEFVKTFWILFIAYAANAFPVLARGKRPIDFGKKFFDGRRVFGDGKTFEGFIFGVFCGVLVGAIETLLRPSLNSYTNQFGLTLPSMNLFIAFMIAFGTLFGDLIGSFIKRRLDMERGADAPLLDQLNFIVGLLIFSYWFTEITIYMIIMMFILTPIIHRFACIIGYRLKLKRVPW